MKHTGCTFRDRKMRRAAAGSCHCLHACKARGHLDSCTSFSARSSQEYIISASVLFVGIRCRLPVGQDHSNAFRASFECMRDALVGLHRKVPTRAIARAGFKPPADLNQPRWLSRLESWETAVGLHHHASAACHRRDNLVKSARNPKIAKTQLKERWNALSMPVASARNSTTITTKKQFRRSR